MFPFFTYKPVKLEQIASSPTRAVSSSQSDPFRTMTHYSCHCEERSDEAISTLMPTYLRHYI